MKKKVVVTIIPHVYGATPVPGPLLRSLMVAQNQVKKQLEIKTIIFLNQCPNQAAHHQFLSACQRLLPDCLCLSSSVNKGFTGAINDSYAFADQVLKPDWYLVLNNDLRVVPGLYQTLLELWLTSNRHLLSGVVFNQKNQIESFGLKLQPSGLAFPNRDLQTQPTIICGTVFSFSSQLAKKRAQQLWGQVMNPLLFAYHEDVELSLWTNLHFPHSVFVTPEKLVIHTGSQTAKRGSFFQLFLGLRNTIYVMAMHRTFFDTLRYFPQICWGQIYIIGLSIYKGYWWLYPKILKQAWEDRGTLNLLRRQLAEHA